MTKDQKKYSQQAEDAVNDFFDKYKISPQILNALKSLWLDGMKAGLTEAQKIHNEVYKS